MKITRRNFIKWASLAAVGAALGLQPKSRGGVQLLALHRSVPLAAIAQFTAQTGIPVHIRYAQSHTIAAQLSQGFDLGIVPSYALLPLIQAGAVRQLPSRATGDLQRAYDPQGVFSRLAARGVIGINALGMVVNSWREAFLAARLVRAHLPPLESINAARFALGQSINSTDSYQQHQARATLDGLRSFPLAGAQLAIGHELDGWTFSLPAEGVEVWEDCFCLPTNATQPAEAYALMEFLARPTTLPPVPPLRHEPLSPFAYLSLVNVLTLPN